MAIEKLRLRTHLFANIAGRQGVPKNVTSCW